MMVFYLNVVHSLSDNEYTADIGLFRLDDDRGFLVPVSNHDNLFFRGLIGYASFAAFFIGFFSGGVFFVLFFSNTFKDVASTFTTIETSSTPIIVSRFLSAGFHSLFRNHRSWFFSVFRCLKNGCAFCPLLSSVRPDMTVCTAWSFPVFSGEENSWLTSIKDTPSTNTNRK